MREAIDLAQGIRDSDAQYLLVETWNDLCWNGALAGFASKILGACENAVRETSGEQTWLFKDSRGLARALTGNILGAIEDFQVFIAEATDPEQKRQRQRWVDLLKAGGDPFTKEKLRTLISHNQSIENGR